jgi:cell wall-associated NlpC family hydrolase
MPGFYGIFTHVHLTDGGTRRAARAIRRLHGWRKALPAVVAGTAALGVVAGVSVTVLSGPSGLAGGSPKAPGGGYAAAAGGSARALPGGTLTSVAKLPPVTPVTGNAPVVSYAGLTGSGGSGSGGQGSAASTFSLSANAAVPSVQQPSRAPEVAPLKRTLQADLIIVAPSSLPPSVLTAVASVHDVVAAEPIEAVRMKVNGTFTAVLGVDPSGFREFAAKPTAASDALWRGVAAGGIAVSYTMGKLDRLPLGGTITASGRVTQQLRVVAFGTLGIGGVDAVVSHDVARSLGAPANNAIVISVRGMDISGIAAAVAKLLPKGAGVQQLVSVVTTGGAASGTAGSGPSTLPSAPSAQLNVMLTVAMSERGKPYVWGGNGPDVFDCSGLVQWSFRQAGITMPRVAAEQALTGPAVPVNQLQPGDLLFYHTDPSAPDYISHVAIYLGNGWMIQAPRPGLDVEVVAADFGSEFAGAVRVNPAQAAAVAGGVA